MQAKQNTLTESHGGLQGIHLQTAQRDASCGGSNVGSVVTSWGFLCGRPHAPFWGYRIGRSPWAWGEVAEVAWRAAL